VRYVLSFWPYLSNRHITSALYGREIKLYIIYKKTNVYAKIKK
jgi:hypothetical protein